jgi:hypothetical protein
MDNTDQRWHFPNHSRFARLLQLRAMKAANTMRLSDRFELEALEAWWKNLDCGEQEKIHTAISNAGQEVLKHARNTR